MIKDLQCTGCGFVAESRNGVSGGAHHCGGTFQPFTDPKRCLNCGLLPVAHYEHSSGTLQCLNHVTQTLTGRNYRADAPAACACTRLPIFTRGGLCVRCGGDPSLRNDLVPGADVGAVRATLLKIAYGVAAAGQAEAAAALREAATWAPRSRTEP